MSALIQQQISVFLMWGQGTTLGVFLLLSTILVLVLVTRLSKGCLLYTSCPIRAVGSAPASCS